MWPLKVSFLFAFLFLGGCASQPKNTDNICKIFKEKGNWYGKATKAAKRWDSNVPMMMAIMHQESRFVRNAKPPREKILWVLPGPRASSAYGYAQAKNDTWEWYQKNTGEWAANRHDFGDAIDFVAWYNKQSRSLSKIGRNDAYNHYLAYHEGQGGFNKRSYNKKTWLLKIARRVERRANLYQKQLSGCEADLQKHWWWPF